jgi:hypothetical protein
VGDSAATFDQGQSDLQGTSFRKLADSVTLVGDVLTIVAVFANSEANVPWAEVGRVR